jgi:hypothetical protein
MSESIYDFAFCIMVDEKEIHKRYCFFSGKLRDLGEQPNIPKEASTAINDETPRGSISQNLLANDEKTSNKN